MPGDCNHPPSTSAGVGAADFIQKSGGKWHSFGILRLAFAAFYVKYLVEANPKRPTGATADKMCLRKGESL
jgi:hypothetical protein